MFITTVDAIFALIFATFALNALRRGWMLLKSGWVFVQTHAKDDGQPMSVQRRHWISQGGAFFIGGSLWVAGAMIAGFLAIQLGFRAIFP